MADKYNVAGENTGFCRFQYSRFDNKQGQYVVRSNDQKEFDLDVDYINGKIGVVSEQEKEIDKAFAPPVERGLELGMCAKCEAPNIIYKKSGKVGCSKFCWNVKKTTY